MEEYMGRTLYAHCSEIPGIADAIVIIEQAFFSQGHLALLLIQFIFLKPFGTGSLSF